MFLVAFDTELKYGFTLKRYFITCTWVNFCVEFECCSCDLQLEEAECRQLQTGADLHVQQSPHLHLQQWPPVLHRGHRGRCGGLLLRGGLIVITKRTGMITSLL